MHYGDKEQIKYSTLQIVVYKHEILKSSGKKPHFNKNGRLSKRDVCYEITSIKKCKNWNVSLLKRILANTYDYLSPFLDFLPLEEFVLVTFKDIDGWGKFELEKYEILSSDRNKMMFLH